MKKPELVQSIAIKSGLTAVQANHALNALTETVAEALANGADVTLVGFGAFGVKERAERTGRNPKTGEKIAIKAVKVPYFKAGKLLKDAVKDV